MQKIKITTPENIEVEYDLADIGSRSGAAIIDSLIQGAFILLLLIAVVILRYFSEEFWEKYYGWIIGIALLIYGIITYGYYIVMELTGNGQTIGKRIMRLRTIRDNGQPMTFKHSAIRNLFKVFIDMFGIGLLMIFFTKRHKRLGDYAASTIVVNEISEKAPVTLEELEDAMEAYNYYISFEEQQLLREYFKRKPDMDNCEEIKQQLKQYFYDKFNREGNLNNWKEFIDRI